MSNSAKIVSRKRGSGSTIIPMTSTQLLSNHNSKLGQTINNETTKVNVSGQALSTVTTKRNGKKAKEQLSPNKPVPSSQHTINHTESETKTRVSTIAALSLTSSVVPTELEGANIPMNPIEATHLQSRGDHGTHDHQHGGVSSQHINSIIEQHKRKTMWLRAEISLTQQAKSFCRRLAHLQLGDGKEKKNILTEAEVIYTSALNGKAHPQAETAMAAMYPLITARTGLESKRKEVDKIQLQSAKQLPPSITNWVETTAGFGFGSLAAIVGEAGDLGNYSTPAKLWKRMGLAVMGDGQRQRKVTGAAAREHGYSPPRRSVMWNIGDTMLKTQLRKVKDTDGNKTKETAAVGPYGALYLQRKAYEIATAQAQGLTVCPSAKIPKGKEDNYRSEGHIHNRAKRYIEKRLLRDLWRAWRITTLRLPTNVEV